MAESAEFMAAVQALVADDVARLMRCLDAHPHLVRARVADERFIAAIVHQVYRGDTLLHLAAAGFRSVCASHLLERTAVVEAVNRRGAQPLHYASDANHQAPDAQTKTIVRLLAAGADPNARDKSGTAPLHRAVRTRSSAAVRALLEGGADARLKNGSGSTPWTLAHLTTGRGGTGTREAKARQSEIICLLQAYGAAPET